MRKVILLTMAFSAVINISCSRAFHKWNAKRAGEIVTEYKTQDAGKRLRDLHWFEEQYQLIKQTEIRYKNAEVEEEKAIKNILNGYIGQYNARMRSWDREMWANNDLPREIKMIE